MSISPDLLLQNAGEGIITTDQDGFIKYANPAVSSITGYGVNELLNQSLSIFYPSANDSIKTEYELSQAKKKGKFISEGWRIKKDRSNFWAEMLLSPLSDKQQNFAGYLCILRDVSDKKKTEIELRRSEERYRLMVESVKDYAIFLLDTKGYIVTWNEGAEKIKGYRSDEIIGKNFSVFYTAEDIKNGKPQRELEIAAEKGKYEDEGWRLRKNGSAFWNNIVITALFNEQNILVGFSKVTRDLSHQRKNEELLRQSEERYRLLVEQVNDYGIFMLDDKGRIISWNEGARKIKGYEIGDVLGKYFSIFYPEEDIISGKPAYELKIARAEGKYEEEGWRIKKDGSRFWANVVITAVYNNEGVFVGFSKVTRDLTERKQAENELRKSYENSRRLNNELTSTNAALTYANEELEQFTSIVSHDLQEPIRTIKSFLQLIDVKLNAEQSADLKNYIDKCITAANRMKELIQNLLHYSQLSRGEMVYEELNVNDLLSEVIQNLKTAIETSGANITIENKVDTIYGDRVQLAQLIQNLLSNALKFTASEHPSIKISCIKQDGEVKFEVTDNGIGIREADIPKVFEIFRRLDTKKEYPGTGIGLAICKKIVDRHQGKIWPESKPGKGTSFYFTLDQEIKKENLAHEKI